MIARRNKRRVSSAAIQRRGFTLIEMMIVILIICIMTSITIPLMSSASDVRRAGKGHGCQHHAGRRADRMQVSGRPAGVWIQRLTSSTGQPINAAAAMDIYLGRSSASLRRRHVECDSDAPNRFDHVFQFTADRPKRSKFACANLPNVGVQNGDLVRFEFRGEYFVLSNVQFNTQNQASTATITPLDSSLSNTMAATPQGSVPFQILRHPIKALASPVQLSDGVAVDLAWSGADTNPGAAITPNTSQSQPVNPLWWWPNVANNADQYWFSGVSFFYPTPKSTSSFPTPPITTSPLDVGGIVITFNSAGALDLVYVVTIVNRATVATPYRPFSRDFCWWARWKIFSCPSSRRQQANQLRRRTTWPRPTGTI